VDGSFVLTRPSDAAIAASGVMPRADRKKSESGVYRAMLRGINRQTIFEDDEDCEKQDQQLRELSAQGCCIRQLSGMVER
jgi:hypothetical protein